MSKPVEVSVIVNSADCTGDADSWTPDDFLRLAEMFMQAAEALRTGQHIILNCDAPNDPPDQFAQTFCSISISQPYGGEQYVKEFEPPGMLDIKKLIRQRNKRMGGRRL